MTSCWAACAEPRRATSESNAGRMPAGWSIATCSLIDRCIDRCRNGFSRPALGRVGRGARRFGIGQVGGVFRMRLDPVGGDGLERRQRQAARRACAAPRRRSRGRRRRRVRTWPIVGRSFSGHERCRRNPSPRRARSRRKNSPSPRIRPQPGRCHERRHRTALRPRPHPQRLHDRAGLRRRAAPHLRPDEVGPDLGQQLAGADRLRSLGRRPRRGCSAASRRATSRRRARRR